MEDKKKATEKEQEIDQMEKFKGKYMSDEARDKIKEITGEEVEDERVYISFSREMLQRKREEINHNEC